MRTVTAITKSPQPTTQIGTRVEEAPEHDNQEKVKPYWSAYSRYDKRESKKT